MNSNDVLKISFNEAVKARWRFNTYTYPKVLVSPSRIRFSATIRVIKEAIRSSDSPRMNGFRRPRFEEQESESFPR